MHGQGMILGGVVMMEESYFGPVWASFQAQLPRIAAQGVAASGEEQTGAQTKR